MRPPTRASTPLTDLWAGAGHVSGAIMQRIRRIDEEIPLPGVKTARYGPISRMKINRGKK